MPSATTSAGSTEDIVDDGDDAVGTGDVKSTTTSKYIQFCVTQADLMEEMDKVKAAGAREDDPSSEIVLELIADFERSLNARKYAVCRLQIAGCKGSASAKALLRELSLISRGPGVSSESPYELNLS